MIDYAEVAKWVCVGGPLSCGAVLALLLLILWVMGSYAQAKQRERQP